jgi:hypothetical protein
MKKSLLLGKPSHLLGKIPLRKVGVLRIKSKKTGNGRKWIKGNNQNKSIRNIMEIIKLTKKEEEWIKELKKLIRNKPKNLILFADGNLNILKLDKDDNDGVGENGRMKSDRIVEIIINACDGGVF